MVKTIWKVVRLVLIMGLLGSFLAGCAKKVGDGVGQGTGITEAELTGADAEVMYSLSEYELAGIVLEYTNDEMWGMNYQYEAVPGNMITGMYFDETDSFDYKSVENKAISEEQWNELSEYIRSVQGNLMFIRTETSREKTDENKELSDLLGEEIQVLDGYSGRLMLVFEKDGEQFLVSYHRGTSEVVEIEKMLRKMAEQ